MSRKLAGHTTSRRSILFKLYLTDFDLAGEHLIIAQHVSAAFECPEDRRFALGVLTLVLTNQFVEQSFDVVP